MDISYNMLIPLSWLRSIILNLSLANFRFPQNEFLFILVFLGKVLLVFAGGAIMGKLLKLEKAYDDPEHKKESDKSSKPNTDTKKFYMSKMLVSLVVIPLSKQGASHDLHSYLIGGIIALLIMCYLVYTLIKPEKF